MPHILALHNKEEALISGDPDPGLRLTTRGTDMAPERHR